MKKLLLLLLLILIIWIWQGATKINCQHLTGADYDRCYINQVRGR